MTVATPKPQCTKRTSTVPWSPECEALKRINKILESWGFPSNISTGATDRTYVGVCVSALNRLMITVNESDPDHVHKVFYNVLYILSYAGHSRNLTGIELKAAVSWFCMCLGAVEQVVETDWSSACRLLFESVPARKSTYLTAHDSKLSEDDLLTLSAARALVEKYSRDGLRVFDNPNLDLTSNDIFKTMYLSYRIRLHTQDDSLRDRQENVISQFLEFLISTLCLQHNCESESYERTNELRTQLREDAERINMLEEDVCNTERNIQEQQDSINEKTEKLTSVTAEIKQLEASYGQKELEFEKVRSADETTEQNLVTHDTLTKQCEELQPELEAWPAKITRYKKDLFNAESSLREKRDSLKKFWEDIVKEYKGVLWPTEGTLPKMLNRPSSGLPSLRLEITINTVYFKKLQKDFESGVAFVKESSSAMEQKNRRGEQDLKESKAEQAIAAQRHQKSVQALKTRLNQLLVEQATLGQQIVEESAENEELKKHDFDDNSLARAEEKYRSLKFENADIQNKHLIQFNALCDAIELKKQAIDTALSMWKASKTEIDYALSSKWDSVVEAIRINVPRSENPVSGDMNDLSDSPSSVQEESSSPLVSESSIHKSQIKENLPVIIQNHDTAPSRTNQIGLIFKKVQPKKTDQDACTTAS